MEGKFFGGMDNFGEMPKNITGGINIIPEKNINKIDFQTDLKKNDIKQKFAPNNEKKEIGNAVREKIDERIGEFGNIDKTNHFEVSDSIIKEFGVENNERMKSYIFACVGLRAQISREKSKVGGKEMYTEDEIKYRRNVTDFIKKWRDEPQIIDNFWHDVEKEYKSFEKAYEGIKDQTFRGFKYGVLGEMAAYEAAEASLEKLDTSRFGIKKIRIEESTVKEDKDKAIDFKIVITYLNGKEEVLACQAKTFDLHMGKNMEVDGKIEVCKEKMVNLISSNRNKERSQKSYYTGAKSLAWGKEEDIRNKGFSYTGTHSGISFFIPADPDLLKDNGVLSERSKRAFEEKFLEQFNKHLAPISLS